MNKVLLAYLVLTAYWFIIITFTSIKRNKNKINGLEDFMQAILFIFVISLIPIYRILFFLELGKD